jgi:hypothetical protein
MTDEDTADAVQPDFLEHLVCRLGVDGSAVLAILGDWLVHYQPLPRAIREMRPDPTVLQGFVAAPPWPEFLYHQGVGPTPMP